MKISFHGFVEWMSLKQNKWIMFPEYTDSINDCVHFFWNCCTSGLLTQSRERKKLQLLPFLKKEMKLSRANQTNNYLDEYRTISILYITIYKFDKWFDPPPLQMMMIGQEKHVLHQQ